MMKLLGLGVVLAALYSAPVFSAGLTLPGDPSVVWTGPYVGVTAGGQWTDADIHLNTVNGPGALYSPTDIPGLNAVGSPNLSDSNGIFGGKVGYDYQWNSFVFGIEGDMSWFRFDKSAVTTGNPFAFFSTGAADFNTKVSTSWLATIRPRIGYSWNQFLFYGTGGLALSSIKFSDSYFAHTPLGAGNDYETSSSSSTKIGWAVGAGIDYAITSNVIVSLEYLHIDLGSTEASGGVTSGNPNTATFNFSTKLQSDMARIGVKYKF
jgi:outer membrane immunogenic protein